MLTYYGKNTSIYESLKKGYHKALAQIDDSFAVDYKTDHPLYEFPINKQSKSKKSKQQASEVADQQSTQENYKHFGRDLIPREGYIKRKLADFLVKVQTSHDIIVRGYQGQQTLGLSESISRHQEHQTVSILPIFSADTVPDMKNGHVTDKQIDEIFRCLVIEVPGIGITGAIYFNINVASKRCHINRLGITKKYQGRHFGSILLHSAIYIALQYQCNLISLYSTYASEEFYASQGFKYLKDEYFLHFSDLSSTNKFLSKIKLTSPTFNKKELDSLLLRANVLSCSTPVVKQFELKKQLSNKKVEQQESTAFQPSKRTLTN